MSAVALLEVSHITIGGRLATLIHRLPILEVRPDAIRVEQGWIDRAFVTVQS
jgi:hypothetical protein